MTKEQAENLKPGDIVEFITSECYWLAKLVKLDTDHNGVVYWKAKSHGKRCEGVHGVSILKYPENVHLVGHSDL
jgi:hypothetical protein